MAAQIRVSTGDVEIPAILAKVDEMRKEPTLVDLLREHMRWSVATFGPGPRSAGNIDHIRKELLEIEEAPADVEEWIDVAMLAFDGAGREGHSPETILAAWHAKHTKNQTRKWPDWRTHDWSKGIEHIRHSPPSAEAKPGLTKREQQTVDSVRSEISKRKSYIDMADGEIDCAVLLAIITRLTTGGQKS